MKYHFSVAAEFSDDGGLTWAEATLPNPSNWDGLTDPALAFDATGHAFLVSEPLRFDPGDIVVTGLVVYKSTDGGHTWSNPASLIAGRSVDVNDDKSWIAVDRSNKATKGRIYVAWGVGGALRLARSWDGGASWHGAANLPAGADVPGTSGAWAPETTVDADGIVHVVWHLPGSSSIFHTRSLDGGSTFEPPTAVVTGMTGLTGNLPNSGSFPEFPHGKFRVMTLCTGCAISGGRFMVAWADMREGHSRIYYRIGDANGTSWAGPASGQPLMSWFPASADLQLFHPQLTATGTDVVGCAFYEFGLKSGGWKIDTRVAASFTRGDSFDYITNITDLPWDPAVNAPLSHGEDDDTFIGEYFGFDADEDSFSVIWTDTRTGVQELFYDHVGTSKTEIPGALAGIWGRVIGGVASDGGGWIVVNGKLIRVPPRGPVYDIVQALAALDAAQNIRSSIGVRISSEIGQGIADIAKGIAKTGKATGTASGG